jgi:hypothetical protein
MADLRPPANTHHHNTIALTASDTADGSTTTDYSAPSLDGVPLEMFERIAELTDTKDLKALRLVSHSIGAKALRTCKIVLFSEVKVMLRCKASVRGALEQAQHPVVGDAIREIVIYENLLRCPQRAEYDYQPELTFSEEMFQKWSSAYESQQLERHSENTLRLLTALFKTCTRNGSLSALRIEACDQQSLISQRPFLPQQCYSPASIFGSDIVLPTTIAAVIDARLSAKRFSMGATWSIRLSVVEHGSKPYKMALYEDFFRRFEDLELTLAVEAIGESTAATLSSDTKAIRDFCAAIFCQRMTSLNLIGDPVFSEDHQIEEFMRMRFPKLRHLLVRGFKTWWDSLEGFLRSHKNLSSLTLHEKVLGAPW